MIRSFRPVAALLGTLLISFVACPLAAQQADTLRWHTDLDDARTLALQQQKPLFLLFRCER